MSNTYDVGDRVVLIAQFEDRYGTSNDPDTVACKVKFPDGTVTTYLYETSIELMRTALGRYELELDVTMYGKHYYYWYSTGLGRAAGENFFEVRKSSVLEVV